MCVGILSVGIYSAHHDDGGDDDGDGDDDDDDDSENEGDGNDE